MTPIPGAGATQVSAEPAAAVPEGAERRGDTLFVTSCNPSFELLAKVTAHNKSGTAKHELTKEWVIRRTGDTATVPVAELWAALVQAGGLHLVRGLTAAVMLLAASLLLVVAWHRTLVTELPWVSAQVLD